MNRQVYRLKAGAIENLQRVDDELPALVGREVRVAIRSIGLNFADIFAIWGLYGATPKGEFIPGLEYSGVVEAVGPEAGTYQIGDRVMGVTRFGAYATHLNIDERYLSPIPESWSFEEGAAYLVQVLTAYYGLLNLGNLEEGATVLIHSAAGGVGTLANRIAKKYNAYTIGTIGSPAKIDHCKAEGYDAVIVRGKDFETKLEEALGNRPLNLIMECIGGKIFEIGFKHLAPQGRSVVYGAARYASTGNRPNYLKLFWQYFTRPKIDPQNLPETNRAVLGFNLIYLYERVELMHQLLEELKGLDLAPPVVGHTFQFDALLDAIRTFQSGNTIGKVVVNT
ncbi:MAG: zinc-binding dehydrogenase [Phaeodactylibacter sp.]|nr:zinc-binding dehydrogenase [Phaeodactylibacter sp.]